MKHPSLRTLTRILLFCVLSLQLGACSSTRLSYQFADRGLLWWVEDYVDLTGEQEDALLQDLRGLRDWHCETQLPRYSDWLGELRQETTRSSMVPARIGYHRQQMGRFLEPIAVRVVPVASRLLQSLSDEQVKELVSSMREEQRQYRDRYLHEATPEDAVVRVRERAQRWLGDLNDRQVTAIRTWLAAREGSTEAWLDGRERWQSAFAALLEERRQPGFQERLRDMVINYQHYQGRQQQARDSSDGEDIVQLTHQLLVAADDRHWDHLRQETGELKQDVAALACHAEPTTAHR